MFSHSKIYVLIFLGYLGFFQGVSQTMTTNGGVPVGDNQNSQTLGHNGPVLLQDIHLIEKLAAFDRERIPERVVHARGTGAFGYFEATADMSAYTKAAPFQKVGKKTDLAVRFSTVAHGKGSSETARDPRGFAVKFYTEEGNYDIVGNNLPIFFIRDAIKFPDFIHTVKPSPVTNKQDPNRFFDFWSLSPEATHMVTRLYTDLGIPKGYQYMDGSSVHGFKWVNKKGEVVYVKYTWKTKQGIKTMTPEEASMVQAKNVGHATEDLRNAIESKNYPKWDLYVQFIKPEDLDKYDFWPLDATKHWFEDEFPLVKIGTMTLNRNPRNFFEEVESIAMAPGNLIPGVEASEDKMLQGRLFSYFDTQRHRLGGNFQQLPVNQPKNKPVNYNSDSWGSQGNDRYASAEINYEPSNHVDVKEDNEFRMAPFTASKEMKIVQAPINKTNNYGQAGQFYNSLTETEKKHLIANLVGDLSQVKNQRIQKRMITHFYRADRDYGMRVAKALGYSAKDFM